MNNINTIILVFLIGITFSFAQQDIEIEVSFTKGGKTVDSVRYYVIEGDNAYLIPKKDKTLFVNSKYLKTNEELLLLARDKSYQIEFFIHPKKMHFLEITKSHFRIKNLFKRKYIINQGFDSVEIVGRSKKKYNIIEY